MKKTHSEIEFDKAAQSVTKQRDKGIANVGPIVGVCDKNYCDKIEGFDDAGEEWLIKWSQPKVCGAPIYKSKTTGRNLECGGCGIRWGTCVAKANEVYSLMQRGCETKNPKLYKEGLYDLKMLVQMSGFNNESDPARIWADAKKVYIRDQEFAQTKKVDSEKQEDDAMRKDIRKKKRYKELQSEIGGSGNEKDFT